MLQGLGNNVFLEVCQTHAVSRVLLISLFQRRHGLNKMGLFFLEARHVVNKVLLISLFQRRHGVNKMGLFFLEACNVVNKVLLISLFQRRHGVNKMGLFFFGGTPCCQQSVADFFEGTPCCQQSVADFFVSETPFFFWKHAMLSTKCC